MNLTRIALAALGAFVAYFVIGGLMFAALPGMKTEFQKYPAVYRDHQGQVSHMPEGMAAMFASMVVLAVLYAMLYQGGVGAGASFGAIFGGLIGAFAIFGFVVHNHVNLNIGWKLAIEQAAAYFVEWVVAGIVIGLIYRPVR